MLIFKIVKKKDKCKLDFNKFMMFVKLIKTLKMKLKFNGFLVLLVVLAAQLTLRKKEQFQEPFLTMQECLYQVSVLIKGTNRTQTDFDGKFSIKASPNDVLVFSYIGMKNEELTAKSITLKVMQSNTTELRAYILPGDKREKKAWLCRE
jgi:hypothetical protein